MKKSLFVIIEGGDATGKSYQADLLVESFKQAGLDVVKTHEPGGTKAGEMIRNILIGDDSPKMSERTELFLFEAARSAWIEEVIVPSLEEGKAVIADRSFPSTVAYQGYAGKMNLKTIDELNNLAMDGARPDLVIIIDLDYDTALKRMKIRGKAADRIEQKSRLFHDTVYAGYRDFSRKYPQAVMVDGRGTKEEVHSAIVEKIRERLKLDINKVKISEELNTKKG